MRRLTGLVLTLTAALYACAASASPAGGWRTRVMRGVMVPMRDGVKLATDIYLPSPDGTNTAAGRFPCVFARTPYGRGHMATVQLVASGYAVVSQDTRGRGDSEGCGTG
jgi:predicted acyl esterase